MKLLTSEKEIIIRILRNRHRKMPPPCQLQARLNKLQDRSEILGCKINEFIVDIFNILDNKTKIACSQNFANMLDEALDTYGEMYEYLKGRPYLYWKIK